MMSFPLHSRVKIIKGRYKGLEGVITNIGNGWYMGRTYTIQFENQQVRVIPRRKLHFIQWDSRI